MNCILYKSLVAWSAILSASLALAAQKADPAAQKADPKTDRSLTEIIPADAIAVIRVKDASQLPERLEKSPLGKLWQDPEFQKFIAPGVDLLETGIADNASAQAGLEAAYEAVKTFQGETIFSIRLPSDAIAEAIFGLGEDDLGGHDARAVLAMQNGLRVVVVGKVAAKDKAFIEKFRALADLIVEEAERVEDDPKAELILEKVEDNDLHTIRVTFPNLEKPFDTLTFAEVGDVGIVGFPRETVEETIAALKSGLKGDHIGSGPFGTFHQRHPDNDVHLHVNIVALVGIAMDWAKKAKLNENLAENPVGLSVQSLHDALGLGDLLSLDSSFQFDDGSIVADYALQFTKRSGLMNLMAYTNGDMPKADFVPRDVQGASITLFSLEDVWKGAMAIIAKAAPDAMPMVTLQLGHFEKQIGVSIEDDLLANLKPEILSIQSISTADGEQTKDDTVFMLGLKNEQGFEVALDKILALISEQYKLTFEPSKFLGHELHTFKAPLPEPGVPKISYLFAKSYLMISIGKGETLRKILSNMERPGKSLWKEPRVKAAIGKVDSGYCAISYVDFGATIPNLVNQISPLLGGDDGPFDWDNLPSANEWHSWFGSGVGAAYIEKKGLFGKTILLLGDE